MVSENKISDNGSKPIIKVGFAIHDAKYNGILVDLYKVDYGEENCACGHPIAWVNVVENELGEQTFYGSDCIAKLYIFKEYSDIDEITYSNLYNKYHKMFIKFGKLVWVATKYGLQLPTLPTNLAELEAAVEKIRKMVGVEKKKRKNAWKKAAEEYQNKLTLRKARKVIITKYPFFKLLFVAYKKGFRFVNGNNKDYTGFVRDFFQKFASGTVFELTEKQEKLGKYLKSVVENRNNQPAPAQLRAGECPRCHGTMRVKDHGSWTGFFCPTCRYGGSRQN